MTWHSIFRTGPIATHSAAKDAFKYRSLYIPGPGQCSQFPLLASKHKSLQLPKTLGPYNISLNKLLHIPIKFPHLGGGYSDVSGTFR